MTQTPEEEGTGTQRRALLLLWLPCPCGPNHVYEEDLPKAKRVAGGWEIPCHYCGRVYFVSDNEIRTRK